MKHCFIIIIFFSILSCAAQKATKKDKCPEIYKNNFTEILNEKHTTIYNNDTISYSEIRFECVNSAFYTHKIMYDKFGKWNKEIFPSNRKHPILMWENIDLFSNGKKYVVMTNGLEDWKHIYASVMIFDENGKDILAEQTDEKVALTNFFANQIKKHNFQKNNFYELYWKMVDPKHWETMKEYQKK